MLSLMAGGPRPSQLVRLAAITLHAERERFTISKSRHGEHSTVPLAADCVSCPSWERDEEAVGAMSSHNAADQSHLRRPSARCRR